jgi:hypothetical protein
MVEFDFLKVAKALFDNQVFGDIFQHQSFHVLAPLAPEISGKSTS